MTPNEFDAYRERFAAAAAKLGWRRYSYVEHHERDGDCSWEEYGWLDARGRWLIGEDEITEAFAEWVIELAGTLPQLPPD